MSVTPQTLTRQELVGLAVEVTASTDPTHVGVAGEVVTETTQMLAIEADDRVRQIPKATATFAFTLPSGETVSVDGEQLVARPARRTEATGDSKWR